MKKLLMFSISFVVAVVLATGFYAEAYATTYTKTPQLQTVAQWGRFLSAQHVFTGTAGGAIQSQDTVYFPFTPTPFITTGSPQDTIITVVAAHVKASTVATNGDSTYVTWLYQWSTDNTTWNWDNSVTLGVDSGVTSTAPIPATAYKYNRIFNISIRCLGHILWPTPYARIVAIGGGTSGGYHNSPGNVISVDILK